MAKRGDRVASVPSQPTDEIDKEVLGVDGNDNVEVDDDGVVTRAPSVIPVSRAKQAGALNADAVQSNRRRQDVLDRKREGEKGVHWGENDACLLYDDIVKLWPPANLAIHVTRVTGSRTAWYLSAQPRNGAELYEAVRSQIHHRSPECEYQIVFRERIGKEERGRGNLILPSGEFDDPAPAPALQPVVVAPVVQQHQPQHPQQQWPGASPEMPPQRPRWVEDPRSQPAPAPPSPTGSGDAVVMMNLQKQLSDMQSQLEGLRGVAENPMQQQLSDIQAQLDRLSRTPPPAPAPQPIAHQPIFVREPTPPQHPPAPTPAPAPAPVKMPEVPPGYALTMINGMPCFVPLRDLQGLGAPAPAPAVAAPTPAATPAAVVQQQPQSAVEQFAASVGMVRSIVEAASTIRDILPDGSGQAAPITPEAPKPEPDTSPTQVVKIGDVTTVQNKEDGSIRPIDTLIANAPGIMSWLDRQRNDYLARQAAIANGQPIPPPSTPASSPQGSQIGMPPIPGR